MSSFDAESPFAAEALCAVLHCALAGFWSALFVGGGSCAITMQYNAITFFEMKTCLMLRN